MGQQFCTLTQKSLIFRGFLRFLGGITILQLLPVFSGRNPGFLFEQTAEINSGGGITLSGGECLAQPDFCVELAKLLHERDISVYVDTCGCVKRETFEKIIPYVDKFLYDIKAIDATVHERCTGKENDLILENLKYLCGEGCKIEIRYPLVMGYNDRECENIAKFLSGLQGITKVKVLQYHSFSASRYEALGMLNTLPDTQTTLYNIEAAVNIFKSYGVHAVNGMRED